MAAPKGNQYGKANLKYKSEEELEAAIEEYFTDCDNRIKEIHKADGETYGYSNPEPYTMSGLAYAMGIDRRTLINYSKDERFFALIKKARDRVEADVERRMSDKDTFTPGLIFNAKNNFDWKDKTETDVTSGGKTLGATISFTDKPEAND